ncbi:flavodoxin family protein [Thermodesulforhabdus norvegica]|uniref:NADPH-dependent FMN reductase n=1 Tax=Thermodesulforhabdus norvegica TaxID=39841 RepID=A0A1I4QZH6_9BACT|nr:flavodoxin family protein [Thermodesulforhabdus norvegica]SFM45407.1 NADPH-dependent FMN reductase [Thermodesulforhabdus norvegica]
MKVVALLSSPRQNGNSASLARRAVDVLNRNGCVVEVFALNQLSFKGCQACMACKTKMDRCAVDDGLTPVLESVRNAEGLIVATPVYWYDICAQLKTFVDRCYSFLKPDYLTNPQPSRLGTGRKLLFILTQGAPQPIEVYPKYRDIFKWLGFSESRLVHAVGVRDLGDVDKREDLFSEVEKAALWLIGK